MALSLRFALLVVVCCSVGTDAKERRLFSRSGGHAVDAMKPFELEDPMAPSLDGDINGEKYSAFEDEYSAFEQSEERSTKRNTYSEYPASKLLVEPAASSESALEKIFSENYVAWSIGGVVCAVVVVVGLCCYLRRWRQHKPPQESNDLNFLYGDYGVGEGTYAIDSNAYYGVDTVSGAKHSRPRKIGRFKGVSLGQMTNWVPKIQRAKKSSAPRAPRPVLLRDMAVKAKRVHLGEIGETDFIYEIHAQGATPKEYICIYSPDKKTRTLNVTNCQSLSYAFQLLMQMEYSKLEHNARAFEIAQKAFTIAAKPSDKLISDVNVGKGNSKKLNCLRSLFREEFPQPETNGNREADENKYPKSLAYCVQYQY